MPDHQGTLDSAEHLASCVAAARKKDHDSSRAAAGAMDPAVEDDGWKRYSSGFFLVVLFYPYIRSLLPLYSVSFDADAYLSAAACTPFGLRETTEKYAFQSMAWRNAKLCVMQLTVVHRTRETLLLDALTAMRRGKLSQKCSI